MFSIGAVVGTALFTWFIYYVLMVIGIALTVAVKPTKYGIVILGSYTALTIVTIVGLVFRIIYMLFNLA